MTNQEMVKLLRKLARQLDCTADSVNDRTLGTFEAQEYIRNFTSRGVNEVLNATFSTKGEEGP